MNRIIIFGCACLIGLNVQAQAVFFAKKGAIEADGVDTEWEAGQQLYDADNRVHYAFQHDDEFLYILVRTDSRPTIFKILKGGLEIWANPDGKKKRVNGLHYPIGMPMRIQDRRPEDFPGAENPADGEFKMPEVDTRSIRLTHLYGDEGDPILSELDQLNFPLKVKFVQSEDGYWVYEMAVPKAAFPTPKKDKGIWRIGITTPSMMQRGPGGTGNIMGGSGMGGMNGMGMGGGRRPGMGPGMPSGGFSDKMKDPLNIWTKVEMK